MTENLTIGKSMCIIIHIIMWIIIEVFIVKTIQMTLDEDLLKDVDKIITKLQTTRSEFIRRAMHNLLKELKTRDLEESHRKGYKKYPVKPDEFDIWKNEQEWV